MTKKKVFNMIVNVVMPIQGKSVRTRLNGIHYNNNSGILYIDITDNYSIGQIRTAFNAFTYSYTHTSSNYNYAYLDNGNGEEQIIRYDMIKGVIIENLPEGYSYKNILTDSGMNTIVYFRNDDGIDDETEGFFIILQSALDKIDNIAFKIDDIERFNNDTLYTGDSILLSYTLANLNIMKKNIIMYDKPRYFEYNGIECNYILLYSIKEYVFISEFSPEKSYNKYTVYTANGVFDVANGEVKKVDNKKKLCGILKAHNVNEQGNIISSKFICIANGKIIATVDS